MAQERSTGRTGNNSPGTIRKADLGKPSTPARRTTSSNQRPGNKKKPGKSIVNQKTTPWGLIITTIVIVAFAGAIIGVVVASSGGKKSSGNFAATNAEGQSVSAADPYRQPELPAAKAIKGVTYTVEGDHDHVNGLVNYHRPAGEPPIGGDHSQIWANCTGTVYSSQIANENAVHMLEHGAVWITYNPKTLPSGQLAKLKTYVQGVDRTALSPYAGLKTPISLQAWGYQLFVHSASDPRIAQFINALKYNPKTTPENASCSDPYFDPSKSTPGHPQLNA